MHCLHLKRLFFLISQLTKSGWDYQKELHVYLDSNVLATDRIAFPELDFSIYHWFLFWTLKELIIRNMLAFLLCKCHWGHQTMCGTTSSLSRNTFLSCLCISKGISLRTLGPLSPCLPNLIEDMSLSFYADCFDHQKFSNILVHLCIYLELLVGISEC